MTHIEETNLELGRLLHSAGYWYFIHEDEKGEKILVLYHLDGQDCKVEDLRIPLGEPVA